MIEYRQMTTAPPFASPDKLTNDLGVQRQRWGGKAGVFGPPERRSEMRVEFFDVEIDEPQWVGFGVRFCSECDNQLIWRDNYYYCDRCHAAKKEGIKKWERLRK